MSAMIAQPEYNDAEREVLLQGMKQGLPTKEIANRVTALGFAVRTARGVQAVKCRLQDEEGYVPLISQYDRTVKQDEAFQAAMLAAIQSGLESAPIGVYTSDLPFMPRSIFYGVGALA